MLRLAHEHTAIAPAHCCGPACCTMWQRIELWPFFLGIFSVAVPPPQERKDVCTATLAPSGSTCEEPQLKETSRLVPRACWPSYPCNEHTGIGWSGTVQSRMRFTVTASFDHTHKQLGAFRTRTRGSTGWHSSKWSKVETLAAATSPAVQSTRPQHLGFFQLRRQGKRERGAPPAGSCLLGQL